MVIGLINGSKIIIRGGLVTYCPQKSGFAKLWIFQLQNYGKILATFRKNHLQKTACDNYRVEYHHCETFLEEMVALNLSDYRKYQRKTKKQLNLDLLILDDFLLHTITDEREVKVLFEILEKRSELSKSTVICSQREPKSWASMILNDEVSANAIIKRVTRGLFYFNFSCLWGSQNTNIINRLIVVTNGPLLVIKQ